MSAPARSDRSNSGDPFPLLLCVDLQPLFLATVPNGQEVHWRCSFAIEAAQGLGVPVLFTEQVPEKLGNVAPDLRGLAPEATVLAKDRFSALGDDAIGAHVRACGTRQLLLCGLETPICIYQTALDALADGYEVTLLAACIGSRRGGDAASALAQLARAGCAVLPAETVFYALLHDAKHPFFKPFTALVKKYG